METFPASPTTNQNTGINQTENVEMECSDIVTEHGETNPTTMDLPVETTPHSQNREHVETQVKPKESLVNPLLPHVTNSDGDTSTTSPKETDSITESEK